MARTSHRASRAFVIRHTAGLPFRTAVAIASPKKKPAFDGLVDRGEAVVGLQHLAGEAVGLEEPNPRALVATTVGSAVLVPRV
ncbi:MAG: hypothetical protein R3A52_13570 [Polyangiales bacterium]